MFQYQLIAVSAAIIASIFSVQAQSNPPTTCQTATGMSNVNATLLEGDWYEEIRAPAINISCPHIKVNIINNQTQLNVTTNYSPTKNGLVMDKYDILQFNISDVNNNKGLVASDSTNQATYKILSTDYSSNVVLCGYTNNSDPTTSFGIILTRDQIVNSNWLMQLKANASQNLSGFNDITTGNITQSKQCKPASASTSVPALTTFVAAFYVLLKFTY